MYINPVADGKQGKSIKTKYILIWDKMLSHTCMGVPYEYMHMGNPIRVWPIYAYGAEHPDICTLSIDTLHDMTYMTQPGLYL